MTDCSECNCPFTPAANTSSGRRCWQSPFVSGLVSLPCCSAWAVFGLVIRRLLCSPFALNTFNGTLAALLLASMLPALFAN